MRHAVAYILCGILLSGCMQPPVSDSVANNIGAAYAQIKILAVTALEARQAGLITLEQGQGIGKRLQQAQDAVRAAELMLPKSEDKAAAAMSTAITILDSIRRDIENVGPDNSPGPSPGDFDLSKPQ